MNEQPNIPPSVLIASRSQARPMIKMVNQLLKARLGKRSRGKGLTTGDVKISHKKIKYY